MREHKFRVWCDNKKEWETDYMGISQDGYLIDLLKRKPINQDTHFIQFFTGFYDKNRKEIYEEDIVIRLCKEKSQCVLAIVEWEQDGLGLFKLKTGWTDDLIYELYDLEIIGNIREHPELVNQIMKGN